MTFGDLLADARRRSLTRGSARSRSSRSHRFSSAKGDERRVSNGARVEEPRDNVSSAARASLHLRDASRGPVLPREVNHPVALAVKIRALEPARRRDGGVPPIARVVDDPAIERVPHALRHDRDRSETREARGARLRRAVDELRRRHPRYGLCHLVRHADLIAQQLHPKVVPGHEVLALVLRERLRGVALVHAIEEPPRERRVPSEHNPRVDLQHVRAHHLRAPRSLQARRPQRVSRGDKRQLRVWIRVGIHAVVPRSLGRIKKVLHAPVEVHDHQVAVERQEPSCPRIPPPPTRRTRRARRRSGGKHLRCVRPVAVLRIGLDVLVDDVLEEAVTVQRRVLRVVAPGRVALSPPLRGVVHPQNHDVRGGRRRRRRRLGRPLDLLRAHRRDGRLRWGG